MSSVLSKIAKFFDTSKGRGNSVPSSNSPTAIRNKEQLEALTVLKRVASEPRPVHWVYRAVFNGKYKMFRVTKFSVHCDFMNNYMPEYFIEGWMDAVTYNQLFGGGSAITGYTCTIERQSTSEDKQSLGRVRQSCTYKCFPQDISVPGTGDASNNDGAMTGEPGLKTNTLDYDPGMKMVKVKAHLVDENLFNMREATFAGIFQKTNPYELLNMALNGVGQDYNVSLLSEMNDGVTKDERMIVVPRGTRVKDLSRYLQNTYGMSPFGVLVFAQRTGFDKGKQFSWYQYTLNKQGPKVAGELKIYYIKPEHLLHDTGRSYGTYSNPPIIEIYTTDKIVIDAADNDSRYNKGTGFRYNNVDRIDGPEKMTGNHDNELVLNGKDRVGTNNDNYKSGDKLVDIYGTRYNTKPLSESANYGKRKIIYVTWKDANFELLKPGMAVSIYNVGATKETITSGALVEYWFVAQPILRSPLETGFAQHVIMAIAIDNK